MPFRRHGRYPSIGGINNERGLPVGLLPLLPIVWWINRDGLVFLGVRLTVGLLLSERLLLSLREFFVGQKCSGSEIGGPLHGDICNSRPLTLKVGIAPWCFWRSPFFSWA